ncbi:MAG: FAD-binding and (Fe-S)-binding domain-containing protein, partial [Hyphomicrobiaceae bacterium]
SRATIGGMAGNNSCGTRSLRYGIMRDCVVEIDGLLANGSAAVFSPAPQGAAQKLHHDLVSLGAQEADQIRNIFPNVSRRVGGYNVDALTGDSQPVNLATLLVGSEGTLSLSRVVTLRLAQRSRNKALGVCHFPTFRDAMEAAQHIVKLAPVAVELVDRTLIDLARDIPLYETTLRRFVHGTPDALLLTEFAEDDQTENLLRLDRLDELMGDLGFPDSVFKTGDTTLQKDIWELRKSGLNIMMSMKEDRKPVSFIEDCAVPLEHLADYTERLTEVFEKHGTRGTWYAHASVGCLHVRPVLNLKLENDANTMRAIAEEAFEFVREYKGAHSGEHGDGLVRSEFHVTMYGERTVALFEEVKERFDPDNRLNPGKIVFPSRMNDRSLFRYPPDYGSSDLKPALDWSAFSAASPTAGAGGFQGAVEMCNNNGACRKLAGAVMCPSYRVTRNERDVTRGRANTLRLALSGQLGADALTSDQMMDTLKLCVSCKACRHECPTGVDMAKMKLEVLAARARKRGTTLHDRLIAYLPRYAPFLSKHPWLGNARDTVPGAAWISEKVLGLAASRPIPVWQPAGARATYRALHRSRRQADCAGESDPQNLGPVVMFADTFNRYFEPDTIAAASGVLEHLGYEVIGLTPTDGKRPVCCGRTFLSSGLIDQARVEAQRFLSAVRPHLEAGTAIVGLEPSCLLTLRDEFLSLGLGDEAEQLSRKAVLLEEFLMAEIEAGHLPGSFGRIEGAAHVHGHCHQKAFGAFSAVTDVLEMIDGLDVRPVESSCCGMAGAFGYHRDTQSVSMEMAELSLLPTVRKTAVHDIIVADGFSCQHQIAGGTGRTAVHAAKVLARALQNEFAGQKTQ